MLGRVLGGISCSLLFSSFEAWLIAEHKRRGFSERLLGDVFSLSVFLGSGLVAIVSGLVGEILVQVLGLGPVAPFDAAVVLMVVGGAVVIGTWGENYGDVTESGSLGRQLRTAAAAILSGGCMQHLFQRVWVVSQSDSEDRRSGSNLVLQHTVGEIWFSRGISVLSTSLNREESRLEPKIPMGACWIVGMVYNTFCSSGHTWSHGVRLLRLH